MSNEDDGVVDFSDPKTKAYQERIAAAKSGRTPLGGAEMPSMPRLDQPPPGAPRDRGLGVQQSHSQQGAAQQGGRHAAMTAEQYQQATAQGQAIQGVGGAYVANQPRNMQIPPAQPPGAVMEKSGEGDQPANPARPEGGLSPETVEQLNAVAAATAAEQEQTKAAEDEKAIDKNVGEVDEYDDYDYSSLGQVTRNLLSDKKRREAIEARCEDMDFEDLILNQELRQEVKIKKKFVPIFRTPTGDEDLYTKRKIGEEDGSDRYIMDKYAVYGLCCGLYSINDKPLPDHRNAEGKLDDKLFDKKMEILLKYPIVIVADLSVNFTWFTFRVQKLLSLDKVKDF